MKVCIRCNPVSRLYETGHDLRCQVHGDQYVLEEQGEPYSEPQTGPQVDPSPDTPAPDTDLPAGPTLEQ